MFISLDCSPLVLLPASSFADLGLLSVGGNRERVLAKGNDPVSGH